MFTLHLHLRLTLPPPHCSACCISSVGGHLWASLTGCQLIICLFLIYSAQHKAGHSIGSGTLERSTATLKGCETSPGEVLQLLFPVEVLGDAVILEALNFKLGDAIVKFYFDCLAQTFLCLRRTANVSLLNSWRTGRRYFPSKVILSCKLKALKCSPIVFLTSHPLLFSEAHKGWSMSSK